jgi:hypothetical protein
MSLFKWHYDSQFSSNFPERVEVVKETECFVTIIKKDRQGKDYQRRIDKRGVIFETFDEAKQVAIDRANKRIKCDEEDLKRSKLRLHEVSEWKEPT